MSDKRGLVVSYPLEVNGNSVKVGPTNYLDPQELRGWLLFWDMLNYPANDVFSAQLTPDEQFLANAGILDREMVQAPFQFTLAIAAQAHMAAFRKLDADEPGVWSLATGERSFIWRDQERDFIPDRGILVKLYQAIPVPDKDVPLDDILKFREKRRSELLAFRHHLEDVYQCILKAGDGALAMNAAVERLQEAIADHVKVSREWGVRLRLSNLNAGLNLLPGVTAALGAHSMGHPILAAMLGAGPAMLSINFGVELKGRRISPTPFAYISSYNRELF